MSYLGKYRNDVVDIDKKYNIKSSREKTTTNLMYWTLCIAGEVGEFVNIVKKIVRDGSSEALWKAFDEELIDILVYLIELAEIGNVDFDKEWERKIKILHQRFAARANPDYCVGGKELERRNNDT